MKKSKLVKLIKEVVNEIKEQKPAPSPSPSPTTIPDRPDRREKPRRRRIITPDEAPDTKPKAVKESEEDVVNKITKRFINLKKNRK